MAMENLLKNKWTWIAVGIILLIIIITIGGGEEKSIPETSQPQVSQEQTQPTKTQISAEPHLLGKWFGKRNVYLGKMEDSKYMATFDPPLPKKSLFIPPCFSDCPDPIFPYLVGLLNEVWGLLPSQLSNPQFAPPFIFYEDYAGGEKFPFLLLKDETTGEIYAVSFWKE